MFTAIIIVLFSILSAALFLKHPQFGKMPKGVRLEKIKTSPNYANGAFQNVSPTPDLTEGASFYSVLKEFLFAKKERNKPADEIPSIKTDLLNLNPEKDIMVWFGHSSYFIQIDGKKILVDPVLSGSASPVSFTTKAFKGADQYTADDIPEIDYLFITHDHWDHLDYKTIKKLKPRIGKIICGLGTGAHLEHWGFSKEQIIERDWNEQFSLDMGFSVTTVPARHFSGRGLKRNKALWMSYALQTPTLKIYIGGDSGYDSHFAKAGEALGPFDIAILENGQYDKNWKYIHMTPEEVIQATKDLSAKRLFPVHSAKFALANHAWDEPLNKVSALSEETDIQLITPRIGEITYLKQPQKFSKWWTFTN
jgi:L-ascorbate metabolism protein UlaG (beta-lactamase superfamily)